MMAQTVTHWLGHHASRALCHRSKHVGNAGQCDAEDGGIAERPVDETAGGIFMIRHNEGDEDAK